MKNTKRVLESVRNGISRIWILDIETNRKSEPIRGARFRVGPFTSGKRYLFTNSMDNANQLNKTRSCTIASVPINGATKSDHTKGIKFSKLCEEYKKNILPQRGKATQVRYLSYFKHFSFFNDLEVGSITAETIDAWITHLKRPEYLALQNKTRVDYGHEFSVLKSILSFYQSRKDRHYHLPFLRDHITSLKVRESPIKPSKDLPIEDFKRFLDALVAIVEGTEYECLRYLALFQYLFAQRVQDAAALHFEDFDLNKNEVVICKKVVWTRSATVKDSIEDGTKSSGGKRLPLDSEVKLLLQEWMMKTGKRRGLMFELNGKFLKYRAIQYRYDSALKLAGIDFRGTHFVRISSVTEAYHQTKDIKFAAELAGHSNLKTTEGYTKSRDKITQQNLASKNARFLSVILSGENRSTNGQVVV